MAQIIPSPPTIRAPSVKHTRVEIKLDMRILLLLVAVIVWPPLHNLHILQCNGRARRLGMYKCRKGDYGCDGEGYRGKEAKHILDADKRRVHRDCSPLQVSGAGMVAKRRSKRGAGFWRASRHGCGNGAGAWTCLVVFSLTAGALTAKLGRARTQWKSY